MHRCKLAEKDVVLKDKDTSAACQKTLYAGGFWGKTLYNKNTFCLAAPCGFSLTCSFSAVHH